MNLSNLYNVKLVTTSLCLTMLSAFSMALPSDRSQPLNIDSDTAERDELKGTTTYAGTVVMVRGSMKITADQVIIHSQQDKITQVIAVGHPARYRQTPREGQEPVIAAANRIEYQISKDMLYLIKNAALEQEGTSLTGNKIVYDVKQSIVKAGSTNNSSGQKKRVKMVIPPKSLSNEEETKEVIKEEP